MQNCEFMILYSSLLANINKIVSIQSLTTVAMLAITVIVKPTLTQQSSLNRSKSSEV